MSLDMYVSLKNVLVILWIYLFLIYKNGILLQTCLCSFFFTEKVLQILADISAGLIFFDGLWLFLTQYFGFELSCVLYVYVDHSFQPVYSPSAISTTLFFSSARDEHLDFPQFSGPQTKLRQTSRINLRKRLPGEGCQVIGVHILDVTKCCQIVLQICWLIFLKYFGKIHIKLNIWFCANI